MTEELAIQTIGLEKSFKEKEVLKGITLQVPKGSVFALLGENGAGKTTFINLLTTLSAADAGEAIVAGYDVLEEPELVREAITVTGQNVTVDPVLTGYENLVLIGKLRHVPDPQKTARELLGRFELQEAGDKPTQTYSGGMKRRLDIALSLIGDPDVIFLDEPSTGLDPAARREVWDTIDKLAQSGTTIFLTTQYMEEAEHLADIIAVLHGGRIIALGDKAAIKTAAGDTESLEEAFLALTAKGGDGLDPFDAYAVGESGAKKDAAKLMQPKERKVKRRFFKDTWTLTARMLKHNIRSMDTVMTVLGMPVLILLVFVFVLGGAMDTGEVRYVDFIVPAVLLMCMASGVSYTAFRVNGDVQSGMFDRFRTMPIARSALIGGHVAASVIVNAISCLALIAIAVLIGFRPQADAVQWVTVAGLLLLTLVAFTAIGVAFGIIARSSEGSGMFTYLLMGLLFVSSGFAPTETMPAPLQVFADYQPMTPIINSIRGAFLGLDADGQTLIALVWLLAITIVFTVIGIRVIRKQKA